METSWLHQTKKCFLQSHTRVTLGKLMGIPHGVTILEKDGLGTGNI